MITSETQVRDFEKSQPLPSFRLRAPNTNPFIPQFPASVTGMGPSVQFTWNAAAPNVMAPDQSGRLLSIVETLRRDVGRFPKSAMVRVNLAVALSNQGDVDEAEGHLRAALELEPTNYLARISHAHLLAHSARFEEASKLYNELLAERPTDNTVLVSLAVMALRSNSLTEAEEKLRLAIGNKDGDATIHFLLGVVRLAMGNLGGAVAELRTASRLDVRNPTIHQALGVIFAVRSEFERAEQEFRAALILAPNDRSSIRSLYQVLLKQGKASEAVDLLKLFVERDPTDSVAREALALGLFDLKQFSSARFHLSRMLGENNNLPVEQVGRIQANIGLSWLLEGKEDSARTALARAIEMHPGISRIAYENLARLYLGQDNPEAARDVLVGARTVFPESIATAMLLSHVYSILEDVDKAIKVLTPFKVRDDAPVELYVYLSFYQTLIGNIDQSIQVAIEGLSKFPHSALLINNLAYVYAMTDRIEEARAALRRVGKDIQPSVELTATRGLLRLREGDEKRGTELYQEAEHLATEAGNRELARRVRQKRHLELARYLIRKKAFDQARVEIKHGLAVRVKHFSYAEDLITLSNDLEATTF